MTVLVREPEVALLAGIFHVYGLPHLHSRARGLDEAGRGAETSKGKGEVLAAEGVAVVVAHDELRWGEDEAVDTRRRELMMVVGR